MVIMHRDPKVASGKLHRDTAPGFDQIITPRFKSGRHKACTAMLPVAELDCTMTAKNTPCFAPYGLIRIVTKTVDPADVLRSTQHRLLTLTAGPLAVKYRE
jgi:hypothetical protein